MIRCIFFFILISSSAFCQSLLEGTVVDKETGKPVPFASIGITDTYKATSSNKYGQFSISVTQPFSLKVTSIGYESQVINSSAEAVLIQLKPTVTQLATLVVSTKPIDARRILRKAFARVADNYQSQPFLQKFFYRHYCKDGDVYGRLIEAYAEVWKNNGYRSPQKSAGEKEAIRVIQIRRSLDKTEMAQGHEPFALENILQADLVGYQAAAKTDYLSVHADVSNLKTDFEKYSFEYKGITYYDDQELYEVTYSYKKDSALTTSGKYIHRAWANGTLYITTDSYAFVKAEDLKSDGINTIKTSVYYRKYDGKYYPYHLIREGEDHALTGNTHSFHIELMSVEIKDNEEEKFTGRLPGREDLLQIPYDSAFWSSTTMLKTTPVEDDIIHDLGGGTSLNKQFYRYQHYEMNVRNGGVNGEEKFNWLREDSKGNRILYLVFWSANFQSYLTELELAKRLLHQYRNKITFVFLSLDDDELSWQHAVQKYSLYADGIINYRIGSHSAIAKSFKIIEIPYFILISRDGVVYQQPAKAPSDLLLKNDFNYLMDQTSSQKNLH